MDYAKEKALGPSRKEKAIRNVAYRQLANKYELKIKLISRRNLNVENIYQLERRTQPSIS